MLGTALEGTQPGLTWGTIQAILTEEFGYSSNDTRFLNLALNQYNRALLDISKDFPSIRRFNVHDATVTISDGVSTYDVRNTTENGGWGWDGCVEILSIVIPDLQRIPLELMTIEQWRPRMDLNVEEGRPWGAVIIDNYNVRLVPTPQEDLTGTGDYRVESPRITDSGDRPDWPAGWDLVALMGAEAYLSKSHRPRVPVATMAEYQMELSKIRRGEFGPRQRPDRAVVTRALRSRRFIPHDNSTDYGWRR
jgi:hypothetical protein